MVVALVTFAKLMGGQASHLILYRDVPLWLLRMSCEPQKMPAKTSHIYLAGLNQDLGHVSSQHFKQGLLQPSAVLLAVLCHCRFQSISTILDPPCRNTGVANTHHAEITISDCHHGPSVYSWTREEMLCLLSCLVAHPEDMPEALVRPHLGTVEVAP